MMVRYQRLIFLAYGTLSMDPTALEKAGMHFLLMWKTYKFLICKLEFNIFFRWKALYKLKLKRKQVADFLFYTSSFYFVMKICNLDKCYYYYSY